MTERPSETASLRVLVADTPLSITDLRGAQDVSLALIVVNTMEEAAAALDQDLDAIVCNIHFNGSRMFELLRLARTHPMTRSVPFVCFRDLDTDLGPSVTENLTSATRTLGATAFIDFHALKHMNGIADMNTYLRDLVVELAGSGQALPRART